MNKKTFILVFFLTFSGFLALQIFFNYKDIHANQVDKKKGQYSLYEEVFQKVTLSDQENKAYQLSKIKAPVVILNFWASWCMPCLEEFPSLVQLKKKYDDNKVLVLGINADDEAEKSKNISKTVKKYNINFPIISDSKGEIAEKFLISAIPVSIIFVNGKVVEVNNGSKDFYSEQFLEKIESWTLKK